MRPSWPSRRRKKPASTSSPTGRSAARVIRTDLRPRSRASTSTIRARRSTAAGIPIPCPGWSGKSAGATQWACAIFEFLQRHTHRRVKVTVPGPFTMAQQAQIDHYGGSRELAAMDYAAALNEEIRDLFNAGADLVQIDEPYMQARPEEARAFGLAALNRALEDVTGTTAVHICFGYAAIIHVRPSGYSFLPELAGCRCAQVSIETAQSSLDCAVLEQLPGKKIILGVIDLSDPAVETPELVAQRIRRALPFVEPRNLLIAPDCGMKYLPRETAFGKLQAMVAGAQMVRTELANEEA